MSIPKPDDEKAEYIRKTQRTYYNDELKYWGDAKYMEAGSREDEILPEMQEAIDTVHPDVTYGFLGCGELSPGVLDGLTVAELGCGNGRDAFALSKLVGEKGRIIGVDLSDKEIAHCDKYKEYHSEKYGYTESNTEFRNGSMEDLQKLGFDDSSVDLVFSNGAMCLVPDKNAALKETYRILKDGGEFQIVDVFLGRRPVFDDICIRTDVWAEASGSAYWKDFVDEVIAVGYTTPRLLYKIKAGQTKDDNLYNQLGRPEVRFIAYRMFKVPANIPREPLKVTYNGGINGAEESLQFDKFNAFQRGVAVNVDGELAAILTSSRFSPFFSTSPLPEGETTETKDPNIDPFAL